MRNNATSVGRPKVLKGKTKRGVDIKNTHGMPGAAKLPVWVLVLDRSSAQIFERTPRARKLRLIQDVPYGEGRLQGREIESDRPGRTFDSAFGNKAGSRHAYESHVSPQEQVAQYLVKKVARIIDGAKAEGMFGGLILVAEPHLLGAIRASLKKTTSKALLAEFSRDYAWLTESQLQERLESLVRTSVLRSQVQ